MTRSIGNILSCTITSGEMARHSCHGYGDYGSNQCFRPMINILTLF